jgi:hypothetical protein
VRAHVAGGRGTIRNRSANAAMSGQAMKPMSGSP